MAPESYGVFLDAIILRYVNQMGYFNKNGPHSQPDHVEGDDIKYFISTIVNTTKADDKDSKKIKDALKGIHTKMAILNQRTRTIKLSLCYDIRMDSVSYEDIKLTNTKKYISTIVQGLYPPELKLKLRNYFNYTT